MLITADETLLFITALSDILLIVFFALWIKNRHTLKKTQQEIIKKDDIINEMNENKNQEQTRRLVTEQRFADLIAVNTALESEKNKWHDTAAELERTLAAFKASATAKEEGLTEKIAYLEQIKNDLTLKFKDISSEIIKSQHETFSLEQKNTLSAVILPFNEQLQAFKKEVVAAREESIKNKANLDAQLHNLTTMNMTLSRDAENLTEALKGGKKMQGNWGECQLSRILEISGLRKGQDFDTQESFINEDKKLYRPDVIIHLPENRDIVIDSKVSLNDYLEATATDDEQKREKSLEKNVQAIKAHIDELSAKEYQKLLKDRALNYVIMFIPIESAYIAALDSDRYLYDYAYKKNVILATPLSLLPILRTVENLWQIDNQNQNVQKIAELGGKIYDKLSSFVEDMKTLERGINQANNAYNNAMTKLTGKGGAVSQAEKMKQLGAKTGKTINLTLNDDDLSLETDDTEIPLIATTLGE